MMICVLQIDDMTTTLMLYVVRRFSDLQEIANDISTSALSLDPDLGADLQTDLLKECSF